MDWKRTLPSWAMGLPTPPLQKCPLPCTVLFFTLKVDFTEWNKYFCCFSTRPTSLSHTYFDTVTCFFFSFPTHTFSALAEILKTFL